MLYYVLYEFRYYVVLHCDIGGMITISVCGLSYDGQIRIMYIIPILHIYI